MHPHSFIILCALYGLCVTETRLKLLKAVKYIDLYSHLCLLTLRNVGTNQDKTETVINTDETIIYAY